MPQTHTHDRDILEAALIGLQHSLAAVEARIADLRSRLGGLAAAGKAAAVALASVGRKRGMSEEARKRIALAQKKRWAAYKAGTAKPAAAKSPKRTLSAEGRARIIAATKKRWAAFHKAQQAPKPAAKKAVRKTAKQTKKAIAKKAPAPATPPATTAAPATE